MFSFIIQERTCPMSGIPELYIPLYGAVMICYSVVSSFMFRILLVFCFQNRLIHLCGNRCSASTLESFFLFIPSLDLSNISKILLLIQFMCLKKHNFNQSKLNIVHCFQNSRFNSLEAAKSTLAVAMGTILKTHGSLARLSRLKGMDTNQCMMPLLFNGTFMLQNIELYNKQITKCAFFNTLLHQSICKLNKL